MRSRLSRNTKTGVARVIAAYVSHERNVSSASSATLERSASRKIKRDAGRDEKAKRARTIA